MKRITVRAALTVAATAGALALTAGHANADTVTGKADTPAGSANAGVNAGTDGAKKPFLNMQVQLSGLWVDYPGEEQLDICADNSLGCASAEAGGDSAQLGFSYTTH